MHRMTRLRWTLVVALLAACSFGVSTCNQFGFGSPLLFFRAPLLFQCRAG